MMVDTSANVTATLDDSTILIKRLMKTGENNNDTSILVKKPLVALLL